MQRFVEENREHSGLRVISQALEKLGEIGDPEGGLEACANFVQPIVPAHGLLLPIGAIHSRKRRDLRHGDARL